MLHPMIAAYRDQGYDRVELEMWSFGFPGTADSVGAYAGTSTESCFEASTDLVFDPTYSWDKDDLWLVDRDGLALYWANLNDVPLDVPANYDWINQAIAARL
jgi:hypothetical protein